MAAVFTCPLGCACVRHDARPILYSPIVYSPHDITLEDTFTRSIMLPKHEHDLLDLGCRSAPCIKASRIGMCSLRCSTSTRIIPRVPSPLLLLDAYLSAHLPRFGGGKSHESQASVPSPDGPGHIIRPRTAQSAILLATDLQADNPRPERT